jgi:hexosaminidase
MHVHSTLFFLAAQLLALTAAIWPKPAEYTSGTSVVWLSPNVQTLYAPYVSPSLYSRGFNRVQNSTTSSGKIIQAALDRFKTRALQSKFVPWKFSPRGTAFEPQVEAGQPSISTITVNDAPPGVSNSTAIDESYTLTLSADGTVLITAASASGVVHALDTLSQLFYTHSAGGIYTPLAPVSVQDKPFYEHRGLNLDISRNWQSPGDVKRTIDGMGFNKFNRLHLHATDGQSWPLEIPSLPSLAAKGAYGPGLTWSVEALQDVQEYAAYRGIQAFLEIDSPGHTAAIAYSYPDLIAAFNQQPWAAYANEPPSGQLKLNSPDVYTFFDTLYADLLPRVASFAPYFHTGGDELNQNVYSLDPTVKSNDASVIRPLLQKFIDHIHQNVRAQGLTPVVWEEMLLVWNLTLPTDVVVQAWLSQDSLGQILAKGHKALFGDYTHWYLDCGFGQWVDPIQSNPNTPIVPPYTDWCNPYKSWREIYSFDPRVNISAEAQKNILGGEVHMWGELTDPVNLDGKIWPRASAASEILWTGPTGPAGVDESVTRRLAEMRERMVDRGFEPGMVQMEWCLQNAGDCGL